VKNKKRAKTETEGNANKANLCIYGRQIPKQPKNSGCFK